MAYTIVIRDYDLRLPPEEERIFRKLKHGELELVYWKIGDKIEPHDYSVDHTDVFDDDLVRLAKAGVSGYVETLGEEGEYTKYVLDPENERVLVFYGEVVYRDEPNEVLG